MMSQINRHPSHPWPHTIVLALAGVALVSCSAATKKRVDTLTYTLPPNCVVADEIPMESTIGVRGQETVKAYPIARYVDPVNKNIMHERTVIYRVESPSHWKLRAQPEHIQLGPARAQSSNQAQGPLSSELKSELAWQKAVTSKMLNMAQNLQGVENINNTAQNIVANQKVVLQNLEVNQMEVRKLKERIEEVAKQQGVSESAKQDNAPSSTLHTSGTNIPPSEPLNDTTAGFKVPASNFLLSR